MRAADPTRSNGNSSPGGGANDARELEPELGKAVVDPSHLHPKTSLVGDVATSDPLASARARLGRAPAARPVALRPAALAAAPEPPHGAGVVASRRRAEAGRRGGRDRDRNARRPALARAARPPRPRRRPRGRGPADRRAGDSEGDGALGAGAADPPAQPAPRRGECRRLERADEGGVVQPGLPRRAAESGDDAAPERQARPLRLPRSRRTRSSSGGSGAGVAGIHTTGIVPVHNATARLSATRLRDWIWQAVALAPDAIESLPAELRVRRGLAAEADALRAAHFPDSPEEAASARDRLAFEELCLHQAALAMRRDSRRRARPGIAIGARGELAERLARLAALRAHRRSAPGARRHRRRPRLRPPDAAAADGGGRLREDGVRRLRDAPRARGGPPGGADGADRDARRAARGDARQAAGAAGGTFYPVRPAHRRDAGRAAPGDPRPARVGRARARRRHPRPARARRRLRAASRCASSTSSTGSASASGRRSTPRARARRRRTLST